MTNWRRRTLCSHSCCVTPTSIWLVRYRNFSARSRETLTTRLRTSGLANQPLLRSADLMKRLQKKNAPSSLRVRRCSQPRKRNQATKARPCKCWPSWTNSAITATCVHIIALSSASVWESATKQFDGWSKVSLMPVQIIPILEFILFSTRSAAIHILRRSPRRLFPRGSSKGRQLRDEPEQFLYRAETALG